MSQIEEPQMDGAGPGRRVWSRRNRLFLILGGPVVILAVSAYFVLTSGGSESTDNAYVQIGKAPVSTSIDGRVVAVYVTENQHVRAGQPLFRLDSRDFEAEAARARADLSQAEQDVAGLRAGYEQQSARTAAAQDAFDFATREAARAQALMSAGVASRQQADEAAHMARQARDQLAAAKQQLVQALAAVGGRPSLPAERQPRVLAASANLERATLNQSYALVLAPTDGIVTRVEQLQPGAYVKSSQTLFWLLTGAPWIEANFKEDQLAHMKVGQPVSIKVDAYPDATLKGHVASFSPGTGAVFSALPAQNATGNWVKVTQRLPVRISFDRTPPDMAARAGLSATVKVDVRAPAAPGAKAGA